MNKYMDEHPLKGVVYSEMPQSAIFILAVVNIVISDLDENFESIFSNLCMT